MYHNDWLDLIKDQPNQLQQSYKVRNNQAAYKTDYDERRYVPAAD